MQCAILELPTLANQFPQLGIRLAKIILHLKMWLLGGNWFWLRLLLGRVGRAFFCCGQFTLEVGKSNVFFLHVTLVPSLRAAGELKTKPTQQSVAKLREIGIQPDMLVCRTEQPITQEIREKLSLFCNVSVKP